MAVIESGRRITLTGEDARRFKEMRDSPPAGYDDEPKPNLFVQAWDRVCDFLIIGKYDPTKQPPPDGPIRILTPDELRERIAQRERLAHG